MKIRREGRTLHITNLTEEDLPGINRETVRNCIENVSELSITINYTDDTLQVLDLITYTVTPTITQ